MITCSLRSKEMQPKKHKDDRNATERIDLGFGKKGHTANRQASCYLHKSPSPVHEGGAKHDSLIF